MEKFNIITDKENKILGFRELELDLESNATPTKTQVTKMLGEKYGAKEDSCLIKKIQGNFGRKSFTIIARIYANKETMEGVEVKKKKIKKNAAIGGKK